MNPIQTIEYNYFLRSSEKETVKRFIYKSYISSISVKREYALREVKS